MQKPDGLVVLTQEVLQERLLTLKLRDLPGIGHNMEQRLRMHGIGDMKTLLSLDARRMRKVWGNLWGERIWYYLRGVELPDEEKPRAGARSGHSHVLGPELRPQEKARMVARRLTLKCAARLRRMGILRGRPDPLRAHSRMVRGWRRRARCYRAQDSMTFLHMLERM